MQLSIGAGIKADATAQCIDSLTIAGEFARGRALIFTAITRRLCIVQNILTHPCAFRLRIQKQYKDICHQ